MRKKAVRLITSFFYLGRSPFMPGTIGSLGGLIAYFIVGRNEIVYAFAVLFLFTLGVLFSGEAERIYKRKDPSVIVIDEATGMLLALYCVPYSPLAVVLGFFLFRVFDILKPPPARQIDRRAGALAIMLDDVVAAIYTNLILQVIFRVFIIS